MAIAAEGAEAKAEEAEQASAAAQESAGIAGTSDLAEYFNSHALDLRRSAAWWTATLAFCLLVVVCAGATMIYGLDLADLSVSEEIARLALSLPILAFAAFAASRANRLHSAAQRSAELAVRLKSIRAYVSDFNVEQKHEVMSSLARQVFSLDYLSTESSATLQENQVNVLQSIMNMVKR